MVSSPPPVRFKLLVFGVFVLLVAVVTFMVLYMLNPFEGQSHSAPAPEKDAPAPAQVASQPAPVSSGFEKEKASDKPVVEEPEAAEPDPKPAPTSESKATVGVPVFEEKSGKWQVTFKSKSELKYKHFILKDPPRLAVDFLKASYVGQERLLDSPVPFISKIRVGEKPEYTRYVIDFSETKVPKYELATDPAGVILTFDN